MDNRLCGPKPLPRTPSLGDDACIPYRRRGSRATSPFNRLRTLALVVACVAGIALNLYILTLSHCMSGAGATTIEAIERLMFCTGVGYEN